MAAAAGPTGSLIDADVNDMLNESGQGPTLRLQRVYKLAC